MWLFPRSAFDFSITELRAMRADLACTRPLTRMFGRCIVTGLLGHAHVRDVWGWALFCHAMAKAD